MKQFLFFILFFSAVSASWAQDQKRVQIFNLEKDLAVQGYDVVAYFSGKTQKGNASLAVVHQGVRYHFSTDTNKETFKKNPAKYEPQYGGWCAYAMGATGDKVEVDPETFKIINGKLYLFYNKLFNNTLKTWNKNEQALKAKADANWHKLSH
jgi:YHS domain-containing protein